jgi:type II secretory pathway pseudopilin PulG
MVRSENGYSLTEALIVVVLLVVVMGGTLSLLDTTAQVAPQENERAHAIREAQVGLATMVRELRQARTVEDDYSPTTLTVRTPVAGVPTLVEYDCDVASITKPGLKACRRIQYAADDSTVVRTTYPVDRLLTNQVFEYTVEAGAIQFVRARIEVPASGERQQGLDHKIVLDDGFFLRNVANG